MFARRHFKPTEIISSDACRGMVEDDENSLDATADAFALVHYMAEMRLKRRKLAVIDATSVRQEDRAQLVRIAKKYHALAVAIVLNPGEDICHERNRSRPAARELARGASSAHGGSGKQPTRRPGSACSPAARRWTRARPASE